MAKSKSKTYTTSELANHFNISVVSASRFIVKHDFQPFKTGNHNAKYYSDAVYHQTCYWLTLDQAVLFGGTRLIC